MNQFLELEAGYLVIAVVIMFITLFVSSRPMFKQGSAPKSLLIVAIILGFFIGLHYKITTDRMTEVKMAFFNGNDVICESRATRKVAQSVIINRNKEWQLNKDVFSSPNYNRVFHTARCVLPLSKIHK